ncbi:MAG: phytanoyl-CoA dioxygenase family protein, partial [Chroococcales cyanobacterium]
CSRLWHRDTQDRRHIKIMVYLNDVDEESGPFEYLPISSTPLNLSLKYALYSTTFLPEKESKKLIPKSKIKSCVGRAGTVVFFEPNGFHHGKMPTLKERHAVLFKYNSRNPRHPKYCCPDYNQAEFDFLSQLVPDDQKEYLWQHNIQSK